MLLLAARGLQPVDYAIVVVYMLAMIAIGWRLSRTQETSEEFFVGGRSVPWFLTGMSLIATLMSTLTYLGTPGEMISHGIAQGISLLSLPFAFVVVGYLWVPFFMRLELTSAYEYLQMRFGRHARWLGVGLYLYMRFLWMGAVIYTASLAIASMTEASAPAALQSVSGGFIDLTGRQWFFAVLLATGIISTLYTMLGGIRAVIWTDVAQFCVLFAGALMTLVVVGWQTGTGPATWWHEATVVAHQLPPLASWDLTMRETVLWSIAAGFTWHICTHASDQVALQRYFSNRDASAARRTAAVNYFLDFLMAILLNLVGMALLTYYLLHPTELPAGVTDPRTKEFADRIFPHFIVYGLPVGVSGMVLAAIFAVAQSSIDSGINSVATVLTVDVVRPLRKKQLDPREELRLAQRLTLVIGTLVTLTGVAIALLINRSNILEMQFRSFNCVLGPLGALFMIGILLRHVGQAAAVIATVLGTSCGVVLAHLELITQQPGPSFFLIIPLSWLVTFLSAAVIGSFLRPPAPEQTRGLTWQAVIYGDEPSRRE